MRLELILVAFLFVQPFFGQKILVASIPITTLGDVPFSTRIRHLGTSFFRRESDVSGAPFFRREIVTWGRPFSDEKSSLGDVLFPTRNRRSGTFFFRREIVARGRPFFVKISSLGDVRCQQGQPLVVNSKQLTN